MDRGNIIIATNRAEIIVSLEDYLLFKHMKWGIDNNGYARTWRHEKLAKNKYRTVCIHMHRLIRHAPSGFVVDHINRNKLDNRRDNLRVISRADNAINSEKVFKAKGIRKQRNRWQAFGTEKNKTVNLGYFDTKIEAMDARLNWLNKRIIDIPHE